MDKKKIVSSIDVGSNSVLLLVAQKIGSELIPLLQKADITRISQNLFRTGFIQQEAFLRTMNLVKEYIGLARQHHADKIVLFGTAPFRIARNAAEVINAIPEITGIPMTVLSQREEAEYGVMGVKSGSYFSKAGKNPLIVELGGASTQFSYLNKNGCMSTFFLDGGVVKFTEQFKLNEIHNESLSRVQITFENFLKDKIHPLLQKSFTGIILLGGSATTVASMIQKLKVFQFDKIDGFKMSENDVVEVQTILAGKPLNQIRELPGMEPGREDIIRAGCLFIRSLMELFGHESVLVSARGPRFGILLDKTE